MYSTLNHVKYLLPSPPTGDTGVIRTLGNTVYLIRVSGKSLTCLTRDGRCDVIAIDPTEYRFKVALAKKEYKEMVRIIKTSNLVGQGIIGYLQKKKYPEVCSCQYCLCRLHCNSCKSLRLDLSWLLSVGICLSLLKLLVHSINLLSG